MGLNSNTTYTVGIINVLYDGQVITNGFQMNKNYKTLKEKPEVSGTEFEIDKRNGFFQIAVKNITDIDNGIENCRYEIYDTRIEGENVEPVLVIQSKKNEQVTVPVDEIKIFRGVPYSFKLVTTFNDNEKLIEYESEYSDIMKMDGVQFPSVRFEEKEVTFERIEGTIMIEDNNNTIDLNHDNYFTITYTDSVGITQSFTSSGSLKIPISINNLRANETYKFSVYTKVDLQDDNEPIEQCYIGGAVIKTKIPQNLKAIFTEDREDVKNTFTLDFRLQNDTQTEGTLEADTLSGMTFSIYAGQTTDGSPIKTLKVVDTDLAPYTSVLKEDFYDKSVRITPEFFGADNKDFRDKYYTISVSSAYDYTQYPNTIPIVNNTFTLETKGYRPDLPTDPNNASDVAEIRNRDKDKRQDLDANTIVGYNVKAKYNNSDLYARKIVYKAYNSNTDELIQTKEAQIGADGVIPEMTFEVGDGTHSSITDTDMLRRGNSYYFVYEIYLDLNGDGVAETLYPYEDEEIILKSRTVTPSKQEVKLEMYPATSTQNSITYKYKATDIDHSLEENRIVATIGANIRDTKPIEIGEGEDYKEVTFQNLVVGELSLTMVQKQNKNEFETNTQITKFYFEGKITLNELKYHVVLDANRVMITLLNAEQKINQIAAIQVQFVGESKTITKDFLYPENSIIMINLNELEELIKQKVTVNVYAYYDTGFIGFDMESEYKLFQKAYKSGEAKYYYTLNDENNLTLTPSATKNMYVADRTDNILKISSPTDQSKTANIPLTQISGGFAYEYELIQPKKVEKTQINTDGSNIIEFDLIIPGISLRDITGNLRITSELDRIQLKAIIIDTAEVQIKDNKIYIDIYQTDENGNNEQFVRSESREISKFKDYITIQDLQPKTYYYMKFRTKIITEQNQEEEMYLYDVDYQVLGKNYYFSTLANVGINDIEITYNPVKYNNKSIDITYKLDRIFGYQKIVYTIEKWNETTQSYETLLDNMEDTLFKKEMVKQISSNPGSVFEFDCKYRLIIKPIAYIEEVSGMQKELELGTKIQEFTLQELRRPLVGINATRPTSSSVNFKITVYDVDRIIENDQYTIRILNSKQEDITPAEYVGKQFSTDLLNNTIKLEEIDKTKEYTIEVLTTVDFDNDQQDLVQISKTYTLIPVSDSGISVGNITTTSNNVQRNKIDLLFTNSYKLTEIDQIRYSIYNINGYSINNSVEFIPKEAIIEGETLYTFTIDESLKEEGRYYIELQFLKEGKIIENYSLEHTYLEE